MVLTRKILEDYIKTEREIKRIQRKLDYYAKHPLSGSHGVVRGSMEKFPYAQCHFVVSAPSLKSDEDRKKTVQQLIIDLSGNQMLYNDMRLEIDVAIEEIKDLEIRNIIQRKYVDRWTDEKIGEEMNYSRRAIGDKLDRWLARQEVEHDSEKVVL